MVLRRSLAALAVPKHLMQEGLCSDLAWFSYVSACRAKMPDLDCPMPLLRELSLKDQRITFFA